MFRRWLLTLGLALCAAVSARATSFLPVTFDELVTRADIIFVGEVADVRPYPLQVREGTIIKTRVVFRVSDPIFGTSSAFEALDFLGGAYDGLELHVAEMPAFAVGDRRMVFARRERSINPVVGFTQGLMLISPDANGIDRVFTLERAPLVSPESIGRAAAGITVAGAPMPLSEFRARVSRALTEARRQ